MKILLFGGFLGSGKTTILTGLIRAIQTSDAGTIAVIENELGRQGIDDLLIGEAKVQVSQLFGGCVCCQITGSLIEAIRQIRREIHPDWLLIEMSGVAYLSGMKELLYGHFPREIPVRTIAVLDAVRWKVLRKAAAALIKEQAEGSDIIIVNKCDLNGDISEIQTDARTLSANAKLLCFSRQRTDGLHLLQALTEGSER